jgi:hypothetical protein
MNNQILMKPPIAWATQTLLATFLMVGFGCSSPEAQSDAGAPNVVRDQTPAGPADPSGSREVKEPVASVVVAVGADGGLLYQSDPDGNRVPDFSAVGYRFGEAPLPDLPVQATVSPSSDGSDRLRIQNAIDEVSAREADENGFRGAVLLGPGTFQIDQTLFIHTGGVVLRGSGPATVLHASAPNRYDVIHVGGEGRSQGLRGRQQRIIDPVLPVNSVTVTVADVSGFKVGDEVMVHRVSTAQWLARLGMDRLREIHNDPNLENWAPGRYDLVHERRITRIEGNRISLDVALMHSIDHQYGEGFIYPYVNPGRIEQVGVEDLVIISGYDETAVENIKYSPDQDIRRFVDENHALTGVVFGNAAHGWARRLTVEHTVRGAVKMERESRNITVVDCAMLDSVSRIAGTRKYSFNIEGQMNLVIDCYSRNARHDYALGSRTVGPNAFVFSVGEHTMNTSEPHHRYAIGGLWDNVRLSGDRHNRFGFFAINRGNSGSGHGWAGANMVFWNCFGEFTVVMQPPGAQNFSVGWDGPIAEDEIGGQRNLTGLLSWIHQRSGRKFEYEGLPVLGDGYIEAPDRPVTPQSLYFGQLEDRLGPEAYRNIPRGRTTHPIP